jgi:hypothetical protein
MVKCDKVMQSDAKLTAKQKKILSCIKISENDVDGFIESI